MTQSSVTSIGNSAFYACVSLTGITVPDGVTSIGSWAFFYCLDLTNMFIPEGVTSIGENAFFQCTNLTSITISGNVTSIGSGAFSRCISLTNVTILEGITTIWNGAFSGCSSLTSVTIPDSVTSIGSDAFYGCNSLTSVTIPDSVTSIGNAAFSGCSSLTSVTIPDSVTSIGNAAFFNCSSLTNITLPEGVTTIGGNAFGFCKNLLSVIIPKSVNNFTFNPFSENTILCVYENSYTHTYALNNNLFYFITDGSTMPDIYKVDGVNYFISNDRAVIFSFDNSVTSVVIPDEINGYPVTDIGTIFKDSDSLVSITIPEGVTTIGDSAFRGCSNLTNITIPEGVTTIGNSAFFECSSLTSVTIPEGVTTIGISAFSGCSSLTNITIPEGVTTISISAFSGCSKLKMLVIPKSVRLIHITTFPENTLLCVYENSYAHTYALNNNLLYFITDGSAMPDIYKIDGVNYFISNDRAGILSFDNSVTSVVIPDEINGYPITDIGTVFQNSDSLVSITIPEGVTTIGDSAFRGCSNLTNITIPEGVTTIGNSAFFECSSLTSVTIPEGVTTIGDSAFSGCSSLTSITIPEGVTTIGRAAFGECSSLTNITIPEGVTTIGDYTFIVCSSLTSVTIPEGVTTIGNSAFSGCSSLTNITLPEGVTTIGSVAFENCRSLTSVTIPDSVTTIGYYAFLNCSSLTNITLPEGVTTIDSYTFSVCSSLTSITIPNSVTSIENWAFSNCSGLTSITLPERLTSIGENAFYHCPGLTSITIPGSVTSIGYHAFWECNNLRNVIVMDGVTCVESRAFEGTAIKTVTIPESVTSLKSDSFPANAILCVYKDSYAHKFAVENDLLYFILRKTGNPEIAFGTGITGTVTYTGGTAASNATVEILYDDGTVKESVVTDTQGNYEFTYAEVGRYTIRATDNSGNTASEVISVKRMNVFDVYLAGETELVLKKGYTISGNVSPKSATLTLTDTDGNVIESITTADGSFVFENITNGSYILRAETENGIAVREVTVFNSNVVLEDIIIEAQGATVTGYVEISDRENNLHRRGWVQVTIYNSDGVAVGSVKSDSDGRYTFTKLPLGEYSIVAECTEMRPDKNKGYDRSHTLTGYGYVNITEAVTYTVNIVLYEENDSLATITGKVTAHGEHQACEVILTNVFRHEIARYETGNNGKYTFKNVRDGVYFITAVTESDGMGFAVVVVKDGKVYGETDITVYKHDRIAEHENKMNEIPHCAGRDDALAHKDKIIEEKRFYDSLSEKEKKQFSKGYRDRLNKLCEWIADCEYTENGGTLDRGGMIISGDELEEEKEIKITLDISPRDTHEIGDEGIQTEADFIQQSIEDTAGHRELAQYYDITLTKNGQSIKNIAKNTDTTGKVRITMPIPDEYKGHKKYTFVHVHNGVVTTLTDLDNNPDTITFEVDKFSIFALCYSDEEETPHTADIEYNAENGKILVSAAEAATLYIAEFEDGKFNGVKLYSISTNAEPFELEFTESQKAFVIDADMIPLCEAFSL